MTMPKKGRREIIVNDTLYYWRIKRYTSVYIENARTGKNTTFHVPEYQEAVTPADVREIIIKRGL